MITQIMFRGASFAKSSESSRVHPGNRHDNMISRCNHVTMRSRSLTDKVADYDRLISLRHFDESLSIFIADAFKPRVAGRKNVKERDKFCSTKFFIAVNCDKSSHQPTYILNNINK